MVYGVILAGGVGSRMGNAEKPKQYLQIGEKPIIIHTVEKMYVHPEIEKVLVLCPEQWVSYTKTLLKKYRLPTEEIAVLKGGSTRNGTIMNAISYIEEQGDLTDETIIVTHDSVRPFITHRIISENVLYARKYGACDTVIAATDTIVESLDGAVISDIPDRSKMYQGQTPQSFFEVKLIHLYESLSLEEK